MITQIYEIQTPQEALMMIDLGVDHIGSVIQSEHQWQDTVLKETIASVRAAGRKSSLIPLFRDPDTISRCVDYYQPDILHFCDALPPDQAHEDELAEIIERQTIIRHRFPGLELMRSVPIADNRSLGKVPSLELAGHFEAISDWFLTDTLLMGKEPADQPVNGFVGITGKTCDWQVAQQLVAASSIPVILAGGIGPENAYDGAVYVQPSGVDSCTRTNATDGRGQSVRFKKDPEKVKHFIAALQRAEHYLKSQRR